MLCVFCATLLAGVAAVAVAALGQQQADDAVALVQFHTSPGTPPNYEELEQDSDDDGPMTQLDLESESVAAAEKCRSGGSCNEISFDPVSGSEDSEQSCKVGCGGEQYCKGYGMANGSNLVCVTPKPGYCITGTCGKSGSQCRVDGSKVNVSSFGPTTCQVCFSPCDKKMQKISHFTVDYKECNLVEDCPAPYPTYRDLTTTPEPSTTPAPPTTPEPEPTTPAPPTTPEPEPTTPAPPTTAEPEPTTSAPPLEEEGTPEPEPTPGPTGQGGPDGTATGDPHCTNVKGVAFDVHTTGAVTFVAVPRAGVRRGGDLLVEGLVEPVNAHPCSPTIITKVNVKGHWLGSAPALVIKPGEEGVPVMPSEWASWMARPHAMRGNVTLEVKGATPRMNLQLAKKIQVNVKQRRGDVTGVKYLDLQVKGLKSLGDTAGGLLGLDDHTLEAQAADGCDPHAVVRLGRHANDEEASTGRMLSLAEVDG